MKTSLALLSLLLSAGLMAHEKPAACCATPDAKPQSACGCSDGKTDQAACCADKSGTAACCAQGDAPKPAACCAVEETADKKPDACCAELENPALKSGDFSAESLYQLDVGFTDDRGRPFALSSLRGRPVVLTMFFASCGYACPLLLTDMHAIQAKLPAEIRTRAALVLVTFDVARDTPAALAKFRAERQLDDQWTLLHGDDDAVRELAALLGVKFKQEADGMFAHSNLITILNPEGEIVHQRNGLRGGLDEAAQAVVTSGR